MYLISYDIESNKIRNKIAKTLEDYGKRVQYSVFECRISKSSFENLYSELVELMMEEEKGNIRFYQLCAGCEEKTVFIGVRDETKEKTDEEIIVI